MTAWIVFALAAIGTYLIRISGLVIFSDPERIPAPVQRSLKMLGPAAMGAIIANALFLDGEQWRAFGAWHIGAAVAVGVAIWRRSQGWAMLAGAVTFATLIASSQ